MPVPPEFERASTQFYEFLESARAAADLVTTHQSYTMTQGVFRAFRRRLPVQDAIDFANVLPLLLRALFVTDWDTNEPIAPFADRESMTEEVKKLRQDHNFSPDDSILCVARALRLHVNIRLFNDVLAKLPKGAGEFWQT